MHLRGRLILIIAFAGTPALADGMSGSKLLLMCSQPKASAGDVGCNAYIRGFHEGLVSMTFMTDAHVYCPPADATMGLFRATVVKSLNSNKNSLSDDVSLAAATALVTAFPCKARK